MTFDVAVVGAGPGGATAARCLAETGISTILIDKTWFPHGKPCAGALTSRVFKRFTHLAGALEALAVGESFGAYLYPPSLSRRVRYQVAEPQVFTVVRRELDPALVPSTGPLEKTYADRVLLCGDAAGFVNPLTGEGIYYAMASGEIAGKTLTEAVSRDELGRHRLSAYQRCWMADFGEELYIEARLPKLYGMAAGLLELGFRLFSADEALVGIVAETGLGRIPLKRSLLSRVLLRVPVSIVKHLGHQLA